MPHTARSSSSFSLSPTKRRSILVSDVTHSRRQSMVDAKSIDNVFLDGPENNDEKERKQRQLNRLQQQIQSKTFSPTSAKADNRKSISAVSGLTSQQLSEHYSKCIQLSAENKININNAFKLQLIDYMSEMLHRRDSEMNNFQVASCTLDASAKIYGYRVDSVHTETLKMAGGLGRTQDNEDKENQKSEGEEEGGERKRKKRKKKIIIESNLKNISVKEFDLDFEVDSLFKKMSSQFDEGRSGSGQFLNSLQLIDDSCSLILDSTTFLLSSGRCEGDSTTKPAVFVPPLEDTSQRLICPTFAPFEFTTWKLGDEDSFYDISRLMSSDDDDDGDASEGNDQHRFDVNAVPEPLDDDMECNGADVFEGDEYDSVVTVGQEGCQRAPPPLMEAVHLKDHLATNPSEYSYFDSHRMCAWAGPSHWKIRPLSKDKRIEESKDDKRKKKEFINLTYKDDADFSQVFLLKRKATKLSKASLKTWIKEKTTMPLDLHFEAKNFLRLFGRPAIAIQRQRKAATVDESVDEYNYNNQNDIENYCADIDDTVSGYGDNSTTGYDVTDLFSETVVGSQPANGEDSGDKTSDFLGGLVAVPNKVEKISIGYARTAKKMDMKKLKYIMWNMLAYSSTDKENDKQLENHADLPGKNKMDPTYNIEFSSLYKSLPQKMSTSMFENLSVPLAFIGLLHLANEHNLSLLDKGDMSDFTIKQG